MGEAATKPRRRTQEERRTATRAALLDATIECLVEFGYGGVTTTKVVEHAGVSRGAQVHHFPTKAVLVAEAVRHLAARRAAELMPEVMKAAKGERGLGDVLDLIWESHNGPLFEASLELWVAARTDPELRSSLLEVEREVTGSVWKTSEALFGAAARSKEFRTNLEIALSAMRGLALLGALVSRRDLNARWRVTRERLLQMFEDAGIEPAA